MPDRDPQTKRFLPGNKLASKGGHARARALSPERRREIAALGFAALVEKYWQGDRQAAIDWLVKRGLFEQDKHYRSKGWEIFDDPGPHPANDPK